MLELRYNTVSPATIYYPTSKAIAVFKYGKRSCGQEYQRHCYLEVRGCSCVLLFEKNKVQIW